MGLKIILIRYKIVKTTQYIHEEIPKKLKTVTSLQVNHFQYETHYKRALTHD
jgi:hypothetical protein